MAKPRVTIGIPVYNGEPFMEEKIKSLFRLGFEEFEIIISDNASTDRTQEICERYARSDNRIRYFRQDTNMGAPWNFNHVLEKAIADYFFWTAVDDVILPGFIEKNLEILEKNPMIVCSAGQVEPFGEKTDAVEKSLDDKTIKGIEKKLKQKFAHIENHPISGQYPEKVRLCLQKRGHQHVFYGIYRTKQLRDILVHDKFTGFDWATILNAVKYGDYHVVDEILMRRYDSGVSSGGVFSYAKGFSLNTFETVFLYVPLTEWCFKHLGIGLFFRNLDCFVKLNLEGAFYLLVDIVRWSKKTMLRK